MVNFEEDATEITAHSVCCCTGQYVHALKRCIVSRGASVLVDMFEAFMCGLDVPGYHNFFQEMRQNVQTWNELLVRFETTKTHFDGSRRMYVELPRHMFQCYLTRTCRELSTALTKAVSPDAFVIRGSAYLTIAAHRSIAWYHTIIDDVIEHVQSLKKEYPVQALFVLGDYAESPIVIDRLKMRFLDLKVVRPDVPNFTVIKGAALYGLETWVDAN